MPRRRGSWEGTDYGLELLLEYDGRILFLPDGYYLKFEIERRTATDARPHGLKYSFTLHDERGRRLLGFDNAHAVEPPGRHGKRAKTHDHWHRDAHDRGRPYEFVDAATLVDDFFAEAARYLGTKGIILEVTGEGSVEEE